MQKSRVLRIVEKFRIVIASAVAILLCSFASFAAAERLELPADVQIDFQPSNVGSITASGNCVSVSNGQRFPLANDYSWTYVDSLDGYTSGTFDKYPGYNYAYRSLRMIGLLNPSFFGKYFAVKFILPSSLPVSELSYEQSDGIGIVSTNTVYYRVDTAENSILYVMDGPYNDNITYPIVQLAFNDTFESRMPISAFTLQIMVSDESIIPPSFDDQLLGKLDDIINQFQGLVDQLRDLRDALKVSLDWMAYNITNNVAGLSVGSTHTIDDETYIYPSYTEYRFSLADEHVQFHPTDKSGTFLGIIHRKFNEIMELFRFEFELFFQWYYPLKDSVPQYWQVYNTDTNDYTMVNPAGVTAYITWYLGKLYQHLDADIDSILEDPVNQTKQAILQLENAENSIKNEVIPSISGWVPDVSSFGSLSAIGYIGNYLQRVFVALSQYNVVIMIGLVLGICMQFIGFFKYK